MVRSSSRRAAAKRHPARAETLEVCRARGPPGPVTLRGLDFALGRGVVGVGDAGKRRREAGEEHKREDHRSLHPDLPPFLLTVTTANTPEAIQRRSDERTLILRYFLLRGIRPGRATRGRATPAGRAASKEQEGSFNESSQIRNGALRCRTGRAR